jgi:hypothetical protein
MFIPDERILVGGISVSVAILIRPSVIQRSFTLVGGLGIMRSGLSRCLSISLMFSRFRGVSNSSSFRNLVPRGCVIGRILAKCVALRFSHCGMGHVGIGLNRASLSEMCDFSGVQRSQNVGMGYLSDFISSNHTHPISLIRLCLLLLQVLANLSERLSIFRARRETDHCNPRKSRIAVQLSRNAFHLDSEFDCKRDK